MTFGNLVGVLFLPLLALLCGCADSGSGGSGGPDPNTDPVQAASTAMTIGPQGTTLLSPMTVEMPYSQDTLDELSLDSGEEADLLVFEYNFDTGTWDEVSGVQVDTQEGSAQFQTTRLTSYRFAAVID